MNTVVAGNDADETDRSASVIETALDNSTPVQLVTRVPNADDGEFRLARRSHPATSTVVTPEAIRPHPKAGPRKTPANSAPRKRGDTKILTDTPIKRQLEEEATQRAQKKVKTSSRKQLPRTLSNSVGNRKPKQQSAKRCATSEDTDRCKICKLKFGDARDPKSAEDWIKCLQCLRWFHDSCAQANGILDEGDEFTCSDCV